MDRVEKYREIIHTVLKDYRKWYEDATDTGVDLQIVSDDAHGQYMLTSVGWRGETRVSRPLHIMPLIPQPCGDSRPGAFIHKEAHSTPPPASAA